jgi:hypothetical protein
MSRRLLLCAALCSGLILGPLTMAQANEVKSFLQKMEVSKPGAPKPNWSKIKMKKRDAGQWCYTGPCLAQGCGAGTRPVCYLDENNACDDCNCENDPVCE